jgi:large subunit ribosomal protein L10
MFTKNQKISFVERGRAQMKKYTVVGVVLLSGIPDRLLQSTKNKMKTDVQFILGRKTLLKKILESSDRTKGLADKLDATSAIILSNSDPFELYGRFKAGKINLAAKPNQLATDDVKVTAGETSIMPGQAVTDLKAAGIDVQIQKGKVIIAKDKVITKKGDQITTAVSKALHTLGITPFSATIEPLLLLSGQTLFTKAVLGIDKQKTTNDIIVAFNSAMALSLKLGIVNAYTVTKLIGDAYMNAYYLGTEAKLYDKGVIEGLLSKATQGASALNDLADKKS